jgi:iron complex outermembrane receptor protein
MKTAVSLLVATISMLSSVHSKSQSLDHGALEELFGEPITTSATGAPQRESQVPATMVIITADEIRRSGARDIPEVLRKVVGIDVLRWGSDQADVAIRGYNQAFSPRLLVLTNGRQVYADFYGFTPWATLPVELAAIRQIEVVKGPNAALFGFNAVGGVINIVTYNPTYDDVRTGSLTAGTHRSGQLSGVTTLKLSEDAALLLSAGVRRNDDFAKIDLEPVHNSRDALSADLRVTIGEKAHVGIEATYTGVEQHEIGPIYTSHITHYDARSIKGSVTADTRFGLLEAVLYHNAIDGHALTFDGMTPTLNIENSVTVLHLQDVFKVGSQHTIRATVEFRDNSMATMPVQGGEVFYDIASASAMWNWALSPTLSLTNAVRWDRLSMGRSGSVPVGYGLNNAAWDRSLAEPSFNSGLVWVLGETDTLRFMIGRGAQLPSLFNLGGSVFDLGFGFVAGVPTLLPSTVTNYEAGWDRVLSALDAELRVSIYHGKTRELVAIVGGSDFALGIISTPVNVGHSESVGVEASIDGRFEGGWRWGASYTYERVRDDFRPGFAVANTVLNFEDTLPRHVLNGHLGWTRGLWEADAYLRYQSDFSGIRATEFGFGSLVPISSYLSLDGRVAYRISLQTTLALAAQNLNQSEQQQTSVFPVERRIVMSLTKDF